MVPLSYYQDNGATSDCLPDAEREFLLYQGSGPAHNQDMWDEFLKALGYSGAIQDMMYEFYVTDEGAIPEEGIDYDSAWGDTYTDCWCVNYLQEWV